MPLPDVVSGLLLSGRSEVQILLATPKTPPKTLIFQGFRRFLFSEENRTNSKQRLAGSIFANQIASPANLPKNHAKSLANRMGECYRVKGIFLKFISSFCWHIWRGTPLLLESLKKIFCCWWHSHAPNVEVLALQHSSYFSQCRKGLTAFAVFVCRYLSGKGISLLPVSAAVLHPFQSECSNKSDWR